MHRPRRSPPPRPNLRLCGTAGASTSSWRRACSPQRHPITIRRHARAKRRRALVAGEHAKRSPRVGADFGCSSYSSLLRRATLLAEPAQRRLRDVSTKSVATHRDVSHRVTGVSPDAVHSGDGSGPRSRRAHVTGARFSGSVSAGVDRWSASRQLHAYARGGSCPARVSATRRADLRERMPADATTRRPSVEHHRLHLEGSDEHVAEAPSRAASSHASRGGEAVAELGVRRPLDHRCCDATAASMRT